jgi:hypothetical protein
VYRTTIGFHERLQQGKVPVAYLLIETPIGWRVFAEKEIMQVFDSAGAIYLGGTVYLGGPAPVSDGDDYLGEGYYGIISKAGRVVSWGDFGRSLQPRYSDVVAAFSQKEIQHLSVQMDNSDGYFSRLIAQEPFLGQAVQVYLGFEDLPQTQHIPLFRGAVTELGFDPASMTLEAEER